MKNRLMKKKSLREQRMSNSKLNLLLERYIPPPLLISVCRLELVDSLWMRKMDSASTSCCCSLSSSSSSSRGSHSSSTQNLGQSDRVLATTHRYKIELHSVAEQENDPLNV